MPKDLRRKSFTKLTTEENLDQECKTLKQIHLNLTKTLREYAKNDLDIPDYILTSYVTFEQEIRDILVEISEIKKKIKAQNI